MMISDCPETYVSRSPRRRAHLACGGSNRRLIVGCNAHCNDGFDNEIQSAFDLTMPETPSDPIDRLGEASISVAIMLRGSGAASCRPGGRLCRAILDHLHHRPGWLPVSLASPPIREALRATVDFAKSPPQARWRIRPVSPHHC